MPVRHMLPVCAALCLAAFADAAHGQEDDAITQLNIADAELDAAFTELIDSNFVDCNTTWDICNSVKGRLSEAANRIKRYFSANIKRDGSGVCLTGDPYRAYVLAHYLRAIGRFLYQRGSGNSYSETAENIEVHLRDYPLCPTPGPVVPPPAAPPPGEYDCTGGWGKVEITSSSGGSSTGYYTATFDATMPGWLRINVAPDGTATGEWGEVKVGRTGFFSNLKVSATGFSANWGVYETRGGRKGDRDLPESSGTISCKLKS